MCYRHTDECAWHCAMRQPCASTQHLRDAHACRRLRVRADPGGHALKRGVSPGCVSSTSQPIVAIQHLMWFGWPTCSQSMSIQTVRPCVHLRYNPIRHSSVSVRTSLFGVLCTRSADHARSTGVNTLTISIDCTRTYIQLLAARALDRLELAALSSLAQCHEKMRV